MSRHDTSRHIASIAANKFGTTYSNLSKIEGGYQNFIYEYEHEDRSYILRITSASTRTMDQVESELDFIVHLSKNNVPASMPIASIDDRYLEEITDGKDTYYVTSFEKAPGRHMKYPEYLESPDVFRKLGFITGNLHNASRTFPKKNNKRITWEDNYYLKNYQQFISEEETGKLTSIRKQIEVIENIPKQGDSFGLIHGDINIGNFFFDKGNITLFDFDECQKSWYVEDIAIQLYYTLYVFCNDSIDLRIKKADEFMENFMEGYNSVARIDSRMMEFIPQFLILREMIVHVGINKMWDFSSLNAWQEDYYRDSSERIRKRMPIVEYNTQWNQIY